MLAQIGGVTGDDGTGQEDQDFMDMMKLEALSHKGNYISIGIPLVPYGFKGGVSNAQISVTNTKDGTLEALREHIMMMYASAQVGKSQQTSVKTLML